MTAQKTPLKNQTEELAVQLLENLDGHWKFHERKIIIVNFLVEVLSSERKSQEAEIQQLKSSIAYYNSEQARKLILEQEKQIETAKRFIIGKRKQLKKDDEIKATWQNQLLDDFERYVFGYVKKGRKQKHEHKRK